MKTQAKRGKQSFLVAPIGLALILTAIQTKALSQDYKPGDPITFGSAHKSMFQPKVNSAPLMMPQSAAPTPDVGNTTGVVPNNFLNTRSIPWRTGDPVTFGAAHKPYSPDDNKPPQTSNSMPAPNIQSTPVAPVAQGLAPTGVPTAAAPNAVPSYAPASDGLQDLQARPGSLPAASFGQPASTGQPGAQPYAQTTAGHKQKQKQKQKPPKQVTNQVDVNQSSAAGIGGTGSGNVFTHFWHWVFGGGNK